MRLNRLLRSSTFRLTLIYFLLFGLSSAGLLAFVYLTTVQVITHQTDETIRAEALGLVEQYEDGGLPALERIVTDRSRSGIGEIGIYLLADEQYQRVAGNLPQWPEQARGAADWYQFPIQGLHGGGHMQVARARTYTLSDDYHLLVGRDMTERSEFRTLISEALLGALGLTVMFGGAGGLFMSRWLLGRIDRVNRTSQQILEGDLSHRVPLDGSDDEFDRLAGNLNRMLDQIEQLIASMRSVSDNIAHDLRTPISRLRSRLEVTLLSDRNAEAYRDAIQDAIGEADQILNTFNALLDIALAESGALRDQFEQVDLTAVVDDVVDLYEPLAEELDVTLSKRTTSDVWIDGNAHLLSQALANLIDNAIKYTPSGGVIVVTNQQHDGKVDLCVSDSGPGIPADKRAEVLRRFSRLEHSRSAAGSGLGLSLVAAVARLHEAEIELSDNAPGLVVRLRFG